MARFFVNIEDISADTISIKGEDAQHIRKVLRMAPGEQLTVCDGLNNDYDVVITEIGKDTIITSILGSRSNKTEPPVEVTLFQGIPKSDKMDLIIQKCTELGISRIVPVLTDRTVVKIQNDKDKDTKIRRWRKIAQEAAKQCQRGCIPIIDDPCSFDEAVLLSANNGLSLIPYEKEQQTGLKSVLAEGMGKGVSVFIGPEGGFSEAEVNKAAKSGILPVTLGPRILRTETAGIAVLSILMYELGDIG